ncbi:EndoU domain-containing protein [Formosimonas limnophila]|uniref:EndoU domain-containing protein n=1 Tax=Formosimonas limnophila TaxID=1384487 RepID=UPI0016742120|nr:EndoU domain-containing protein [Formosimonas limnophila]
MSIYPEAWTQRQTMHEIQGAFLNSSPVTPSNGPIKVWRGVSPSGITIEGFYGKPDGSGATAWPVWGIKK